MTETDTKEVEFNFGDIEVGDSLEPEELDAKEPVEATEESSDKESSEEESSEESNEPVRGKRRKV